MFRASVLPFEQKEFMRFGWSLSVVKFLFLRFMQGKTFQKADGVIFLSSYAKQTILNVCKRVTQNNTIIPFGIDKRFAPTQKSFQPIGEYSTDKPFKVLYVSKINVYKHQWNVVEAVAQLREKGEEPACS